MRRPVGLRLALSWLTVLPVGGRGSVDREDARRAITNTPLVGLVLGGASSFVLWAATTASLPGTLAGLLTVGVLALLTRGMHIDGLADTADGLGCYGPPERAREVMKSGSAGPFGVAAIVLVLMIQAAGFGAAAGQHAWWSVVVAVAAGRVAVVIACRRGIGAASDTGFGALVRGTQPALPIAAWTTIALVGSVWAVADRHWQGPLVVAFALVATALGVNHCVRRFGGISGDVLGATVEATTAITVVGFLIGG